MNFIHAADVHIDSPMRGLESFEGAPVDELRSAPRRSFENIVNLAVDRDVDFLIIAGDLFDGRWRDMQTGIWASAQFHRLQDAKIPAFLLQGNHDADSLVRQAITWPDNVHRFSTDHPCTFDVPGLNVVLHGQGFANRECLGDLVPNYPDAVPGKFNIGVLHTSLTGDSHHDPYAPTTNSTLNGKGYDYWALGHIHARQVVQDHPPIVFAGNSQGRHILESGAKGCYLVTCEPGCEPQLEFQATDCVRWQTAVVEIEPHDGRDEVLQRVQGALQEFCDRADGRLTAVRVRLTGVTDAYRLFASVDGQAEMKGEVQSLAHCFAGQIWIERLKVDLTPRAPIDELRQGNDLFGELLRQIHCLHDDEESLRAMSEALGDLEQKASRELQLAGIQLRDPGEIRQWLATAEQMLAHRLWDPTT